jgi:hypothetical protein
VTAKKHCSTTLKSRIKKWVKQLYSTPSLRRSLMRKAIAALTKEYRLLLYTEALERPHYGYCVYNAALLARRLGHKRISILEFGVAGGDGLVSLESHAAEIARLFRVEIEIYGFDSGHGLPEPVDYRDLPYHWKKGFYGMNQEQAAFSTQNLSSEMSGTPSGDSPRFTDLPRSAPFSSTLTSTRPRKRPSKSSTFRGSFTYRGFSATSMTFLAAIGITRSTFFTISRIPPTTRL